MNSTSENLSKTNIYLYGPPGSGKSSITIILSEKLNLKKYDIDDDYLEKFWNKTVAEKLQELGDEKFLEAEGEATLKLNLQNTIISLTGSNPLHAESIIHLRKNGLMIFLDVDKEIILSRLEKMKVDRIVGQNTKTLSEILDYRKSFYEKYYDIRYIVSENETLSSIALNIINLLNQSKSFISTRDIYKEKYNFKQVVESGLAKDKGLFIPEYFQKFNINQLNRLINLDYASRCLRILESFPIYPINPQQLFEIIKTGISTFKHKDVLPIRKLSNNQFLMEEFHGPTASFKDLSLQMFPLFLISISESNTPFILTATSGDTGSATLHAFSKHNIPTIILYPYNKISEIQEKQMLSIKGFVKAIAVEGDFDDCQKIVKSLLCDENFNKDVLKKGFKLSSANSINWGRLFPQIFYSFQGYLELIKNSEIKLGEKINISVPTGNFGNIFSCFIAKEMGLPIDKLICGSNQNDIVTEFINTGCFDITKRKLKESVSPSIDIINPSNLERLLFYLTKDQEYVNNLYEKLSIEGKFNIGKEIFLKISENFKAYSCSEEKTLEIIKKVYNEENILIDTHTAVAKYAADKEISNNKTLIVSTAHYSKFPKAVLNALEGNSKLDLKINFEKLKNYKSKIKNDEEIVSLIDFNSEEYREIVKMDVDLIKTLIFEFLLKKNK